jgi:hypothetical protein
MMLDEIVRIDRNIPCMFHSPHGTEQQTNCHELNIPVISFDGI